MGRMVKKKIIMRRLIIKGVNYKRMREVKRASKLFIRLWRACKVVKKARHKHARAENFGGKDVLRANKLMPVR